MIRSTIIPIFVVGGYHSQIIVLLKVFFALSFIIALYNLWHYVRFSPVGSHIAEGAYIAISQQLFYSYLAVPSTIFISNHNNTNSNQPCVVIVLQKTVIASVLPEICVIFKGDSQVAHPMQLIVFCKTSIPWAFHFTFHVYM